MWLYRPHWPVVSPSLVQTMRGLPGYTGAGQAIAILDTGVDKTHPFFTTGGNKVVSEACYSSNVSGQSSTVCPGGVEESTAEGSGIDCTAAAAGYTGAISNCRHGTHVAGIAAGNDGGADIGVAKDADIIAIQVFSLFPNSNAALTWTSDQIKGLERVYELRNTHSIAAVNMSLGGGQYFSPCDSDARKAIIDTLAAAGIATVIAAGNNGYTDSVCAPGCISSAITVGATEDDDDVASFSNIASFVDLLAPGVGIRSSTPGGSTANYSGTSMATPHVAGAWALMKQQMPTASVDDIRARLRETGILDDDQRDGANVTGMRRINLEQAVVPIRLTASPTGQSVCAPTAAVYNIAVESFAGTSAAVTLSVQNLPAGATASFSVNPVTPAASSVLTVNTAGALAGNNTLTVAGTDGSSTAAISAGLNLFAGLPTGTMALTAPIDGAVEAGRLPTLSWNGVAGANEYEVQIAMDASFASIVYSANESGTSHDVTQRLDPKTLHYWRVRPQNSCGAGAFSNTFSFTTRAVPPILLVDDDDNSPDLRSTYTDILDALVGDQGYDIWDANNSDVEPDAATLSPYTSVIWFTGDAFDSSAGPGSVGETALAGFLDSGDKCYFISSQDYHWAKGTTGFMQNYLGVNGATNDIKQSLVTGQGLAYVGLGPYTLNYPFSDFSDAFSVASNGGVAFNGTNGTAGVGRETDAYKTTYLAFPLEAVPTVAEREDVLERFLDWCSNPAVLEATPMQPGVAPGGSVDIVAHVPPVWAGAVINFTAPYALSADAVTVDANGEATVTLTTMPAAETISIQAVIAGTTISDTATVYVGAETPPSLVLKEQVTHDAFTTGQLANHGVCMTTYGNGTPWQGVAQFSGNPCPNSNVGVSPLSPFVDALLENPTDVSSVEITVAYTADSNEEFHLVYWCDLSGNWTFFNGTSTIDMDNNTITFTVNETSSPSLSQLKGTPFVIKSPDTPLAVTVTDFQALALDDGHVIFTWQTATEVGTAGFNLLGEQADGSWLPLNQMLIPSRVIDSVSPTNYDFTTVTEAKRFKLQETTINGKVNDFGPFDLIPASVEPNAGTMAPMLWLPIVTDATPAVDAGSS